MQIEQIGARLQYKEAKKTALENGEIRCKSNGTMTVDNKEKYGANEKKLLYFFFICGKIVRNEGLGGAKNTPVRGGGRTLYIDNCDFMPIWR